MTIVRIDHIQLAMPAGGEGVAIEFYEGLLGLEHIPKPPSRAVFGGCVFGREDPKIHLGVEEDFRPARKAHPALQVEGLEALIKLLVENSVPISGESHSDHMDRVYAEDPFGNRIELFEPK